MIAPLRKRHRLMWSVLTPFALGLLFLALTNRPPSPISKALPDTLKASTFQASLGAGSLLDSEDFFADPPTAAQLAWSDSALVLELSPRDAIRQPHVLAYWRPEGAGDGVAAAHLLGQLLDGGSQTFALPTGASGGEIVLYSLAHQQVLTRAALPEVAWPVTEPDAVSVDNPALEEASSMVEEGGGS